jgi:hypothetical protein
MNLEKLSQRLVKSKHFRWMPGMLMLNDKCVIRIEDMNGDSIYYSGAYSEEMTTHQASGDHWPDLTDPATLGCLLHLVREALNEPWVGFAAEPDDEGVDRWYPFGDRWHGDHFFAEGAPVYRTEADALVAALEAAP